MKPKLSDIYWPLRLSYGLVPLYRLKRFGFGSIGPAWRCVNTSRNS